MSIHLFSGMGVRGSMPALHVDKYLFKINNTDNRIMSMGVVLVLLMLILNSYLPTRFLQQLIGPTEASKIS